ncbi:MAG: ISKra4 family transposase [Acidobacteriota bacterium]|nr:ISKra4 family transposase [Acidobacteriota bacterium]
MMSALALARPQLPAIEAYLPAQEKFNQLLTQLRASETKQMTHSQLENLIETEGREVLRRLLQGHLDERAPGTSTTPVVDALDRTRTQQRTHTRQLESLFGTVTVTRIGYGGRALESLHPLDAALNLPPERYSHTLRRRAGEAAAQTSFDEVVTALAQTSGAHLPKRQAEQLVARAAADFDTFYHNQRAQTAAEVRASGSLLVLTTDGKGIPMRRRDLRPVTRQAAEGRQHKLAKRRSRGEKTATKRMGTVAAVYTTRPCPRTPEEIVAELRTEEATRPRARPRPEDKRVWASVEHAPQAVIRQAFDEAVRRDPNGTKQWCALVDGSPYQLTILRKVARDYAVKLTIVLDLIHVCEYVWGAAWAVFREGDPAAEAWVRKRLLEILCGRSSVVAAGLRRSATLRGLSKQERAPLDRCANYLLKYRDYLRYDEYLAAGLPIATGVIEGACRHLVKDRMEVTGARWGLHGAEAVLRLRSLRSSGDFDEYWEFHLQQEYQRHHTPHYAEGKVPILQSSAKAAGKSTHLQLVK